MGYREVTMLEVKEVLRRWLEGAGKKTIAAQLGLDVKTARRYLRIAVTDRVGSEIAIPSHAVDMAIVKTLR